MLGQSSNNLSKSEKSALSNATHSKFGKSFSDVFDGDRAMEASTRGIVDAATARSSSACISEFGT